MEVSVKQLMDWMELQYDDDAYDGEGDATVIYLMHVPVSLVYEAYETLFELIANSEYELDDVIWPHVDDDGYEPWVVNAAGPNGLLEVAGLPLVGTYTKEDLEKQFTFASLKVK